MQQISQLDLKSFFFIGILILVSVVMFQLFAPFLNVIVLALVLVQVFHPMYKGLQKILHSRVAASLISTFITIFMVVVPLIVVSLMIVSEISTTIETQAPVSIDQPIGEAINQNDSQRDSVLERFVKDNVNNVNNLLSSLGVAKEQQLKDPDLNSITKDVLTAIQNNLLPLTGGVISVSASALFSGFLLIVTLIYLFIDYENLPNVLNKISPLDDKLDNLLFRKFTETNSAVIRGSFIVAICQASAVSLVLMLLQVGAPALLWVLMVILSLIPVGSGVIWFPIGLIMILNGNVLGGICLILYSGIVINVIDTLLRPVLMKNSVNLHPLITIFSALGGIAAFGPLGILYGPVIAVFFTSLMKVYTEQYTDKDIANA